MKTLAAILFLFSVALADATQEEIIQLPPIPAVSATTCFPGDLSGTTYYVTAQQLSTYISSTVSGSSAVSGSASVSGSSALSGSSIVSGSASVSGSSALSGSSIVSGSASVSGSSALSGSSTVSGSSLSLPLDSVGEINVQKCENVALAGGATVNLLTVPPGTAGVVEFVQVAIQSPTGSNPANVTWDSKLNIQADGVSAPGQQTDCGTFFRSHGGCTEWATSSAGVTDSGATGADFGGYRKVQIPFTNGIIINFVNGSSDGTANLYTQVIWRAGATLSQVRKHWHCQWTGATTLPSYSSVDLLPLISGTGEIESVYLLVLSNSGYTYLEGNPTWTIDGTAQAWGGTEDYFGGQYYWKNGAFPFQVDDFGVKMGSALQNLTAIPDTTSVSMWRNHYPNLRIPFSSSAKFTWFNGQSGEGGSAPGNVTILSLVTYWTAQ